MEIEIREKEEIIIVDVSGEIDLYNAPEIKEAIKEQMDNKKKKVIINLEKVNYIDSSGIGALISSLSNLRKVGGDLKLLHVYDSVKKVLELTKLTSFFGIYDNEEKAIAAFEQ